MLPKWPHSSPCFLCCHGNSQLKIVLSQVEESMHSDTGKALLAGELRGRAHSFLEQAALCGVFHMCRAQWQFFPLNKGRWAQASVGQGTTNLTFSPTSPSLHEPLIFGASLVQTPPAGPWRAPASVFFHAIAPLQLPQSPALCGHLVPAYWLNKQDGKIRIVTPCFRICLSAADSCTSKLWHVSWLDPQTQRSELGLADSGKLEYSHCAEIQTGTLLP